MCSACCPLVADADLTILDITQKLTQSRHAKFMVVGIHLQVLKIFVVIKRQFMQTKCQQHFHYLHVMWISVGIKLDDRII